MIVNFKEGEMKKDFSVVDKYRVKTGMYKSNDGDDFGMFEVPVKKKPFKARILCAPSDSEWEHVSVSTTSRTLDWVEMCKIKDMFWDKDEAVIQFHPPENEYINNHPFCLHLWKKKGEFDLPPSILVGLK